MHDLEFCQHETKCTAGNRERGIRSSVFMRGRRRGGIAGPAQPDRVLFGIVFSWTRQIETRHGISATA
jgi:hypothetical protein